MEKTIKHNRKSNFFLIMGIIALSAILIGFSTTFIIPISKNNFKAPKAIYFHGFFALSWVLLFTVQSFLIRTKNIKIHIRLGIMGVVISLFEFFTLIPVSKFVVERDFPKFGEATYSSIVGNLTTGIMFITLVGFGLIYRKNIQLHKRLLLLATLIILWPAWFRFRHFFPNVPNPEIWFGVVLSDIFIVISMVWDYAFNRKIHPVLLYVGSAIILENIIEIIMYDSPYWRTFGKELYLLCTRF